MARGQINTGAGGLVGLTSTVAELNILDGVPATLTSTELGYVDGVTSAIQTQLDGKALFKSSTGTFASGSTTYQVTDAFITAATLVFVNPTQTPIGAWSVSSTAGSFTITSTATETATRTFDWGAIK